MVRLDPSHRLLQEVTESLTVFVTLRSIWILQIAFVLSARQTQLVLHLTQLAARIRRTASAKKTTSTLTRPLAAPNALMGSILLQRTVSVRTVQQACT